MDQQIKRKLPDPVPMQRKEHFGTYEHFSSEQQKQSHLKHVEDNKHLTPF